VNSRVATPVLSLFPQRGRSKIPINPYRKTSYKMRQFRGDFLRYTSVKEVGRVRMKERLEHQIPLGIQIRNLYREQEVDIRIQCCDKDARVSTPTRPQNQPILPIVANRVAPSTDQTTVPPISSFSPDLRSQIIFHHPIHRFS
jgi:hypothetical protein